MERYRIVEGVSLYFITLTVVDWLPLFVNVETCGIIADSLNFCTASKFLGVNAYVIMPTHVHAIIFDREFDADRLDQTLDSIRKFTGRRLADYCDVYMPPAFSATLRARAGEDRKRHVWQAGKHPVGIVTQAFWRQKLDYIHANPVRKGLVAVPEAWRYSSASYWADQSVPNDVRLADVGW